jgi:hypothetical protein
MNSDVKMWVQDEDVVKPVPAQRDAIRESPALRPHLAAYSETYCRSCPCARGMSAPLLLLELASWRPVTESGKQTRFLPGARTYLDPTKLVFTNVNRFPISRSYFVNVFHHRPRLVRSLDQVQEILEDLFGDSEVIGSTPCKLSFQPPIIKATTNIPPQTKPNDHTRPTASLSS